MSNISYIKMPSLTMIKKAKDSLDKIEKLQQIAFQKCIEKERENFFTWKKKRENSLWSRLFGCKEILMPSDQELLKIYDNSSAGLISGSHWIKRDYAKSKHTAIALLNAALQADEIFVSTEDLLRLL